jgi:4-diphosphocytidyl-2-C-methyl-D-erythritol kinase
MLTFSENDNIVLTCDDPSVPTGERNLVSRAAMALQREFGISAGARISLEKRIPSPGGLGGGSSNAAVALIGLRRLWSIDASDEKLVAIGGQIGSDVPFFLTGGTALGTGRGDKIESMPDVEEKFLLIVTPNVHVSTRDAFGRLEVPNLTNSDPESILRVCRFTAESGICAVKHW